MNKEKTKKLYLRELKIPRKFTYDVSLDIIEKDYSELKEDKKYIEKIMFAESVRYFELKGVRV